MREEPEIVRAWGQPPEPFPHRTLSLGEALAVLKKGATARDVLAGPGDGL